VTDQGWRVLIRDEAAASGWGSRQPNELLRYYCSAMGGRRTSPAHMGRSGGTGDDAVIAVPDQLTPQMREWDDVLQRLARFEAAPASPTSLPASSSSSPTSPDCGQTNDIVIRGSIPLALA